MQQGGASEQSVPQFDLSDRMRKALTVAHMGVTDMAHFLGVSRNTVGRYTSGRTRPDTRTLRLWAQACDVPFMWLAYGEQPSGEQSTESAEGSYQGVSLRRGPPEDDTDPGPPDEIDPDM
jgi:transcriptional regulator with XRE-family HTH domain